MTNPTSQEPPTPTVNTAGNTQPTPTVNTAGNTMAPNQPDAFRSLGKNEWGKREIGALWKKEGNGQTYLRGQIKLEGMSLGEGKHRILLFSNRTKKNDSQPDFYLYLSKDDEDTKVAVKLEGIETLL